jgi:hypothetical protein
VEEEIINVVASQEEKDQTIEDQEKNNCKRQRRKNINLKSEI